MRVVSRPYCRLLYSLRTQDIERVPAEGPVILAPNHFSGMDHWFVGLLLPRQVRFMAKSQLFKGPCWSSCSATPARSPSAAASTTRSR